MAIERISIDPIRGREEWLELRRRDITASDVPAVCGEGLFKSAGEVWAEKRGLISAAAMSEPMKRGIWGEAAVFEALAWERPDWELLRAKVYLRDPEIGLGATPDGVASIPGIDGITVVQAKVIGLSAFEAHWIGEGADIDDPSTPIRAPIAYQLQTLTESHLAAAVHAIIAVLVVSEWRWWLRTVPVPRHLAAEAAIREKVVAFRRNYLETGIQPPIDPERDEDLVKKLYPEDDGSEIDLTGDNEAPLLVSQLEDARSRKKAAEGDEKVAKTALAGKLGSASFARIAGGRRISHKAQTRGSYFVDETTFRVMRVLKG